MEDVKTEETENEVKQESSAQEEEPVIQNPANPPLRDTQTARDLRNAGTKEVFRDMKRRGMIM